MTTILQSIENNIRDFFEKKLVKVFRHSPNLDVFDAVMICMFKSARTNQLGQTVVADYYVIHSTPEIIDKLNIQPGWHDNLIRAIQTVAHEKQMQMEHIPIIQLSKENADFSPSILVESRWQSEIDGRTGEFRINTIQNEPSVDNTPTFLVLEGERVFPLEKTVINIGRQSDNDLVINDPRVSRKHAQIRILQRKVSIFDLGSTGGTLVNGQVTSQFTLKPGDVISLGGYRMIFGEESSGMNTDKILIEKKLRETGEQS